MNNQAKKRDHSFLNATIPRVKLGDFPPGSLRSRAAARALIDQRIAEANHRAAAQLSNLNPFEEALIEDQENHGVKIQIIRLARVGQRKAEIFGFSLPSPEEIRSNRVGVKEGQQQ